VAWLLAPRGLPWRASGLALMLPAFALPAPAPPPGEAWITVLDVGRGRAVLVRTSEHALLVDAGPAFAGEGDAGERIVVPALRSSGVSRLDAMVLSRDDPDHIGGAQSVMEGVPTGVLLSGLPAGHPALSLAASPRRCARGDAWEWDGVRIELAGTGCTLRVSAGGREILLQGGGSIAAKAPGWVAYSVGDRSRFRQPGRAVLARHFAAGERVLRTDRDGAISIRLGAAAMTVEVERARRARYWRGI
jgi:competence protein ComEC